MQPAAQSSSVLASVRSLLEGAVDYEGLFPPSALSMPEAVLNYATYKNSNYAWMLGRFVVGADRLEEFFECSADFFSRNVSDPWQIAVVATGSPFDAIRAMDDANAKFAPSAVCDVLECKPSGPDDIAAISQALPRGAECYFELVPGDSLGEMLGEVSRAGQNAKLRTGGVVREAFPSSDSIVRFVQACTAADVPFKATAGLHHPIRCFRPLTYEADSVKGTMHGFLNLFLMTGFARQSFKPEFLEGVMEEEFEEVFAFYPDSAKWREMYVLTLNQIAELRSRGIRSFGSCSFDEPVEDLQALGIL